MSPKSHGHRREPRNTKRSVADSLRGTASPSRSIRVFVAESHEVVRAGVCALLEEEGDLEVVGETDNAEDMFSEL